MSDILQDMRQNKNTAPVAWMSFLQKYSASNSNDSYIFLEGKDTQYYIGRIDAISDNERAKHYIDCKGKENVLHIYQLINLDTEYNELYKAFFIDKDFDELLTLELKYDYTDKEGIYCTPCYSIENFYCSIESFKKILLHVFGLEEDSKDYENAFNKYGELIESYYKNTKILIAWILAQRNDENSQLMLANISILDYINFDLEKVEKNYYTRALENRFKNSISLRNNDMLQEDFKYFFKKISELPLECIHRGKFIFEFFIDFLKRLCEDINQKTNRVVFENKKRMSYQFSTKTAISTLAQYADTPYDLKLYIKSQGI